MKTYLQQSEDKLCPLLDRVAEQLHAPYMIYGAGSHTARLLPRLKQCGVFENCTGIIDNNKNLQGHFMGGIAIHSSSVLDASATCTVLISSFKAEQSIAKSLSVTPHTALQIYNDA